MYLWIARDFLCRPCCPGTHRECLCLLSAGSRSRLLFILKIYLCINITNSVPIPPYRPLSFSPPCPLPFTSERVALPPWASSHSDASSPCRIRCILFHWHQTRHPSAAYMPEALGQPGYVLWLVVQSLVAPRDLGFKVAEGTESNKLHSRSLFGSICNP